MVNGDWPLLPFALGRFGASWEKGLQPSADLLKKRPPAGARRFLHQPGMGRILVDASDPVQVILRGQVLIANRNMMGSPADHFFVLIDDGEVGTVGLLPFRYRG